MKKSYGRHTDRQGLKLELGIVGAAAVLLFTLGVTSGAAHNATDHSAQQRSQQYARHHSPGYAVQPNIAENGARVAPHVMDERGSVRFIETVPALSGQARSALYTKEIARPAQPSERVSALIQAHIAAVNATLLAPEIAELCE